MIAVPEQQISIHALRVEGDPQSRGPGWKPPYFYPRPPCGGRQFAGECGMCTHYISIHALRVEGDSKFKLAIKAHRKFLSTPSVWRATDDKILFTFQ